MKKRETKNEVIYRSIEKFVDRNMDKRLLKRVIVMIVSG